MNKLVIIFLLFSSSSFGQLISGDLVAEGRKKVSGHSFVITGNKKGYATYELAVNRTGDVTSAKLIESSIKSTPTEIQMRNHVKKFKFEKGTYYPKFHHVKVQITMVKSVDQP